LIAVKAAKVIAPVVSGGRLKEVAVKADPVPLAQEVVTTRADAKVNPVQEIVKPRADAVKVGPVQAVVKPRADPAKVVDAVKVDPVQAVVKPRADLAKVATVTPLPARTFN
jgi:hypothetical protein